MRGRNRVRHGGCQRLDDQIGHQAEWREVPLAGGRFLGVEDGALRRVDRQRRKRAAVNRAVGMDQGL